MEVIERLIRYCEIDTQSDESSGTHPSSDKQFDLANLLVSELKEMHIEDAHVDKYCYVYGTLPSNSDIKASTIGFIAHMDTAPDFSGKDVKPRIIDNYDGKDIVLNPERVMKVEDFPKLADLKGQSLMVTDGNTLLGADDKAGIASIMEAIKYLLAHPEIKHGDIKIAFTPDEEIGEGAMYFDVEGFGADFAYTIDGGYVNIYEDETFNAASIKVDFKGFSIHPGSAKNKMINASNLANEFHQLLPSEQRPEYTENKEGFYHLHSMQGDVEKAELEYIIRDHDAKMFEHRIQVVKDACTFMNEKYGKELVSVTVKYQYKNMYEILKDKPEVTGLIVEAMNNIGITPVRESVRGGTDGSALTFKGLPCPNVGAGGDNFHGPYEYCVIEQLEKSVELVVEIAKLANRKQGK